MANITSELVSSFLTYGKLEEIAEDEAEIALVRDFLRGAVDYLDGAGVPQSSPQWRLALFAMALHDYDHRDDPSAQQAYPLALRLKIDQLKQRNFNYG